MKTTFDLNPLTGKLDLVTIPEDVPSGIPSEYDASSGVFPTIEAGIPSWYIITNGGTLPDPVGDIKKLDYLIYNGTTRSKIEGPQAVTDENIVSMFTLGGIDAGETIPAGTDITALTRKLLLDVFYPTYSNPTFSLTSNQSNGQEIGKTVSLTLTYNFTRGSINGKLVGGVWSPSTFQDHRAGIANNYTIEGVDKALVNSHTIASYQLLATQTFSGQVSHDEGPQPLDSNDDPYQTPYPAGTQVRTTTVTAIYPRFYGKVTGGSKPTKNQALIDSGTKVVGVSTGTITANFNSTASDWIWFAIPQTSASKTKWYIDALNNGNIGGESNLFDTENVVDIDSPDMYWNGIPYKIYVSNYQSAVNSPMELRNS